MSNCTERFITIQDFLFLQGVSKHYEGFVIGLGYAYVGSVTTVPPSFNGYTHSDDVNPQANRFALIRHQYVDNSPEMVERSLAISSKLERLYTVQKDDNVTKIASACNVSADDIIKWNKLSAPYTIYPGQKLIVSESSQNLLTDYLKSQEEKKYNMPYIHPDVMKDIASNNNSSMLSENGSVPTVIKAGGNPFLTRPANNQEHSWGSTAVSVASTSTAIASEMYYSQKYGTWMGKNYKIYKQSWGGSGITGGKNKFAKKRSKFFKRAGNAIGLYNAASHLQDYNNGKINTEKLVMEEASNLYSTFGGIYGAAWGVGWELGREITYLDCYQEFKYNLWYKQTEKKIGKPNQYNETLWMELFYKEFEK